MAGQANLKYTRFVLGPRRPAATWRSKTETQPGALSTGREGGTLWPIPGRPQGRQHCLAASRAGRGSASEPRGQHGRA